MCKPTNEMKSKYGYAKLSAEYIKDNLEMFCKLTIQEQQIFFIPMLKIKPETEITNNDAVVITLSDVRTYLGTTQSDKALRQKIKNTYQKCFDLCSYMPYKIIEIHGNTVSYCITLPSVITNTGHDDYWVAIDLDDISNLGQYRERNDVLPFYLYLATHSGTAKNNIDKKPCRETIIGDKKIKDLCCLPKNAYTSTPNFPAGFLKDFARYWTDSDYSHNDYAKLLTEKYMSKIGTIPGANELFLQYAAGKPDKLDLTIDFDKWDSWHPIFDILLKAYRQAPRHFDRFRFEEETVGAILPILAQWSTIHILEQRVQVQGRNGEKATTKKSLFRKNYKSYGTQEDGSTVYGVSGVKVSGNGDDPADYDFSNIGKIYENGKNYNKLETGRQYAIQYRLISYITGKESIYAGKNTNANGCNP